jgi:hypothetical protein
MENAKAFSILILQLKKLQVKDKKAFNALRDKIMKDYDVSMATLYRHLGKKVPGKRKTRADSGKEKKPVSAKTRKMIEELMLNGFKKKDAVAEAEKRLGVKVSGQKAVDIGEGAEADKTNFGSPARELIRKILDVGMIAPDAGIYFKHNGVAFKVKKEYIEDIAMVLATAYNESLDGEDVMQIDREQMATAQLFHLFQEGVRIASLQFDMKELMQLTRMHKDLKDRTQKEMNTDFAVFEKCMKHIRPTMTKNEMIALVKKYS